MGKIKEWLEQNKVYCREDCLKSGLIEVLVKIAPEPVYAVDEIAAAQGHKVLRTPPYHPELQPIETCWCSEKIHGETLRFYYEKFDQTTR